MNIVYSFGDSMTAPLNGIPPQLTPLKKELLGADRNLIDSPNLRYQKLSPYRQWLGRDAKDTVTFVAEEYGFDAKNMGVNGSSNTDIFHKFISELKYIQSGDILIFGWTAITRYRIATKSYNLENTSPLWKTIRAHGVTNIPEYGCVHGTTITKEVAEQLIHNRYDIQSLYEQEVNDWINFINEWAKLKGVKTIHWSWCNERMGGKQNLNLSFDVINYTDMSKETKNIIIEDQINNNVTINFDNKLNYIYSINDYNEKYYLLKNTNGV